MTRLSRWLYPASFAPIAYAFYEPHRMEVRQVEASLPRLPSSCEGMRIAQLTDLHLSAITPPSVVRRAVAACNAQHPDAVVITGDFITRPDSYASFLFPSLWAKKPFEYLDDVLTELCNIRAPEGLWAVHGNHDGAAGELNRFDAALDQAGITVLTNSSTRLRGALPLIGLDDLRIGRPDVQAACAGIAAEDAQIVLSHNPRMLPLLSERNALVLAGHAHGGQVRLPFVDLRRRPSDMHGSPFFDGWYQHGTARMFISAGIGCVHLPVRFRCPPEVVVLTLKREV
jgi:predicted MPP superfamily phosphohydrolase